MEFHGVQQIANHICCHSQLFRESHVLQAINQSLPYCCGESLGVNFQRRMPSHLFRKDQHRTTGHNKSSPCMYGYPPPITYALSFFFKCSTEPRNYTFGALFCFFIIDAIIIGQCYIKRVQFRYELFRSIISCSVSRVGIIVASVVFHPLRVPRTRNVVLRIIGSGEFSYPKYRRCNVSVPWI